MQRWVVLAADAQPVSTPIDPEALTGWTILAVADSTTPDDWPQQLNEMWSVMPEELLMVVLTMAEQNDLPFSVLEILPSTHARQNVGYLYAVACGAEVIYQSDYAGMRTLGQLPNMLPDLASVQQTGSGAPDSHMVNPFALFGQTQVWPRGFPISAISNFTHEFRKVEVNRNTLSQKPLIQQGIASNTVDEVDAVWRLTQHSSVGDLKVRKDQIAVAIEPGFFSPFSARNTFHLSDAFWGLLIPFTMNKQVGDIWRSYWTQRVLWDVSGNLVCLPPADDSVNQIVEKDADLKAEFQLYTQADELVQFLYHWTSPHTELVQRVLHLSRDMAAQGFWEADEVLLMKAWLSDLSTTGYRAPTVTMWNPSRPRRTTLSEMWQSA